jgi:hypothetical protein
MALPFVNSIISWFLKKRVHQIELFLKYPIDVQEELLLKLVATAKRTEFGEEHDFSSIKNYKDFTNKVPIQRYESIEPLIERCRKGEQNLFWATPIKWFAKSSGILPHKSW